MVVYQLVLIALAIIIVIGVQGWHDKLKKSNPQLASLLTIIFFVVAAILVLRYTVFDKSSRASDTPTPAQRRASAILNDVPYDVREAIKDELRDEINEPEPEKWR